MRDLAGCFGLNLIVLLIVVLVGYAIYDFTRDTSPASIDATPVVRRSSPPCRVTMSQRDFEKCMYDRLSEGAEDHRYLDPWDEGPIAPDPAR